MAELLQQTRQQVVNVLLVDVLLVIEIDVRNPNVLIVLKSCTEVVDDDSCENCLPSSWNTWAEQRLLVCVLPSLILGSV